MMFSNNGLISKKQMRNMLILPTFAGSIFVLPYLFAKMFGKQMILGIITFTLMASIYTGLIIACGKKEKEENCPGTRQGRVYTFINITRYIIRLVFYILMSVEILKEGQVPFTVGGKDNPIVNYLVFLPLLIVAFYGSDRNVEKQGRIFEMIFAAVFFPYAAMILFGLKEADFDVLTGGGSFSLKMSVWNLLFYCYALLTFIVPVEIYPRLNYRTEKDDGNNIRIFVSVMIMVILLGILSFIMAAIYGVGGAGSESMLSVAIMRYIELPMGVLQRFDVLMVWFYMTGCFAIISSMIFNIKELLPADMSCGVRRKAVLLIVVSAFVISVLMPEYNESLHAFLLYGCFVDLPLSILFAFMNRMKNRKKSFRNITATMIAAVILVTFLTGCSSDIENVEERDYATVMMISRGKEKHCHFTLGIAKERHTGEKSQAEDVFELEADSVAELSECYGELMGKDMSLSHLKIIITSISKNEFRDFIVELGDTDEVAKTCPLLVCDDNRFVADYMKNAEEPVGTYINNLIKTAKRNGKKVPKLMDYLKALRENENLKVYKLAVRDGRLTLSL